jgi:hypothetical protein
MHPLEPGKGSGVSRMPHLAQLRAEAAHLGGALRRVTRALGVSQHIEAAGQHVPIALQLRLAQLQREAQLTSHPARQTCLLPASAQSPRLHPAPHHLHLLTC